MQDLAIAARITWREVRNLGETAGGEAILPASPLRIAVAAAINASGVAVTWRMGGTGNSNPIVNGVTSIVSLDTFIRATFGWDIPGIFNTDLFTSLLKANITVYEAVIDTDLSKAVQIENLLISKRGI